MPIRKGCNSVAHMMTVPVCIASFPKGGAHKACERGTDTDGHKGRYKDIDFCFPSGQFPDFTCGYGDKSTAKGPPAPPSALVANLR